MNDTDNNDLPPPEVLEKLEKLSQGSSDLIIHSWLETKKIANLKVMRELEISENIKVKSIYGGVFIWGFQRKE